MDDKTFRRSNTIRGFFPNDPEEEEIVELKKDLEDTESRKLYESLMYRSVFTFARAIATCSGKNTAILTLLDALSKKEM